MPRTKPILVEENKLMGDTYEHPAMGSISVHREHGEHHLHGSEHVNRSAIVVTVRTATEQRNHSHTSHMAKAIVTEFAMSESQWATLLSSMNYGGGIPCTLRMTQKDGLIDGIIPYRRMEQFKTEYDEYSKKAIDTIKSLVKELKSASKPLGKGAQNELASELQRLLTNLEANKDFTAESFSEYMEDVVEKSKIEVHAYMQANLPTRPALIDDTTEMKEIN